MLSYAYAMMTLFIPRHTIVAGYYGFALVIHVSVHLSVFSFSDDNLSECQWIFTKLSMCIDIVEICLGLLMGKFRQLSSVRDMSDFSFLDDNVSKYQWIFPKLGVCIDIIEIWFWIDNWQISSIFDRVICP